MKRIIQAKVLLSLFLLFSSAIRLFAQTESTDPDFLSSIGKIYVVIGVILIIFLGIVLYLVRVDRKLSRLERRLEQEDWGE